MSFEVRYRDMLARLGRIHTKSGTIETPILLPVINPAIQAVSPRVLNEEFDCKALITNAYILKKHGRKSIEDGIHKFLDFDGVIMTDSGAYQILVYGKANIGPAEIVRYQEKISTDIGTILDIPTSWKVTKKQARRTVDETIERAKQLAAIKSRNDILWVGPIQGGRYLDLVAHSAKQLGKLPFQIQALGSPTPIMEQYLFDTLVDMILTAKMNMPLQRPLHLFGAGHPFMFALAIALGCDMFDSAAYAIFAREDRYMTEYGTSRISQLQYLPCSCPICAKTTPEALLSMPPEERHEAIAKHNLYLSFAELRRIKQKIIRGRLWEYLEARSHAHPALLQALKRISRYQDYIERNSPAAKKGGILYLGHLGLMRPEIVRYKKLFKERYQPPTDAEVLVLIPQPSKRPFHNAAEIEKLSKNVRMKFPQKHAAIHICVYAAPFGVVPLELDEVYPLSQNEISTPLDSETIEYVAERVKEYIASSSYKSVIVVENFETWNGKISSACKHAKRKDLSIAVVGLKGAVDDTIINNIVKILQSIKLGDD